MVGDSRGHVHTLKLSPNLRKRSREAQAALSEGERSVWRELEVKKLEQVVSQVMMMITITIMMMIMMMMIGNAASNQGV